MRKLLFVLCYCIPALLLAFAVSSTSRSATGSYAEDRALIEDLQARYMFALDFADADTYVSLFTDDGVLDVGDGEIKGHDAIRKAISGMPDRRPVQATGDAAKQLRAPTGRHNISNIVVKVNGNKALGRAYWFHYGNNNPQRIAAFDSYGHYEDEMVKVNGKWLFSKRRIYNENLDKWAAKGGNPAW
jgi:ketosteroid isomerase-like protein